MKQSKLFSVRHPCPHCPKQPSTVASSQRQQAPLRRHLLLSLFPLLELMMMREGGGTQCLQEARARRGQARHAASRRLPRRGAERRPYQTPAPRAAARHRQTTAHGAPRPHARAPARVARESRSNRTAPSPHAPLLSSPCRCCWVCGSVSCSCGCCWRWPWGSPCCSRGPRARGAGEACMHGAQRAPGHPRQRATSL